MSLLKLDGFDEALIGTAVGYSQQECCAYDFGKVIEILMRDMSEDEAIEFFDFNIVGAYVGESTPIFINLDGEIK
jgi:hypothetical protein|tara:strand:+ start:452 stop:676 length:225 start_codon:yes stop_codon:yes gene_type:complete